MMFTSILAAVALSVAPQDYDTDYFDVGEIRSAEGCAIVGDWTLEGRSPIYVQFDLMTNGEVWVGLSSYGWSRPGADVRKFIGLSFLSSGQESSVFTLGGIPSEDLRPGLVAIVPDDQSEALLDAFANRQTLNIFTADMPSEGEQLDSSNLSLILQAGLRGSADAVTSARRCVANVKRREDARRAREARVDHIARDPFKEPE